MDSKIAFAVHFICMMKCESTFEMKSLIYINCIRWNLWNMHWVHWFTSSIYADKYFKIYYYYVLRCALL